MAKVDSGLIFEAYMEAKEAPKGKHYTKGGQLRKGDADSDGRGGPKFRSDPTYVNPNEDGENYQSPYGPSDADIMAVAERMGIGSEEFVLDGEGGLVNQDEILARMKRAHLEDGEYCPEEILAMMKPSEEDDLGLGHGTPSMIRVTSIGSTTPHSRVRHIPNVRSVAEDETVYIQAGPVDDECDHDQDEHDGEVDMARAELLKAAEYSTKLFDHIADVDSLDGWVAAKITKASDYLSSVFHHLDYQDNHEQVEDEQDSATAEDTGFAGARGIRPLNFNVDAPEIEDGE
mgnify:FL=1